MKTLDLIIKQEWFDAILSGEKKTETREIRPTTAKKYIDYYDVATGEIYNDYASIPESIEVAARPKEYDALRLFVGYKPDRPYMIVKVEGAEIFVIQDENGKEIVYEDKGVEYVAAQIDYALGDIIETNVKQ